MLHFMGSYNEFGVENAETGTIRVKTEPWFKVLST